MRPTRLTPGLLSTPLLAESITNSRLATTMTGTKAKNTQKINSLLYTPHYSPKTFKTTFLISPQDSYSTKPLKHSTLTSLTLIPQIKMFTSLSKSTPAGMELAKPLTSQYITLLMSLSKMKKNSTLISYSIKIDLSKIPSPPPPKKYFYYKTIKTKYYRFLFFQQYIYLS